MNAVPAYLIGVVHAMDGYQNRMPEKSPTMTDRPLDQPSSPVGDEMDYQTLSGSEGSLLGSLGGDRTDQPTASG